MHKGLLWAAWGLSISPIGTVVRHFWLHDISQNRWRQAVADAVIVLLLLLASHVVDKL